MLAESAEYHRVANIALGLPTLLMAVGLLLWFLFVDTDDAGRRR